MESDKKGKVTRTTGFRYGKILGVEIKKTSLLTGPLTRFDTKIEREHGRVEFVRHNDMDVTTMVSGPTIDVAGVISFVR